MLAKNMILSFVIMTVLVFGLNVSVQAADLTLLNVSYDPTRELYQEINTAFIADWQAKTKGKLTIQQSHGGSGKQARAVIDGLEADVVTLALAYDIDAIAKKDLLPKDWQKRLPYNSTPYTSTIVFLVAKGNPKNIKDWDDLVKPGVAVITANPKTSGGARWNYLAAWGYALRANKGGTENAKEFLSRLYKNVPVLDSGARGSTTTFVQRGIGDVLICWENEALLVTKQIAKDRFEIVTPPFSILAEPPVAIVDKVAEKHGTTQVAQAYLEFLYSDVGQTIGAKNYYRPNVEKIAQQYTQEFPPIKLFTVNELFGSWEKAQKIHFDDGGTFDQIYLPIAATK